MNNNLESYLSGLDNHHKNAIIRNCKNNKYFDQFISCSAKLNISLFNNDNYNTPKTHESLIKKVKDYRELIVKSYGMKIIKEYKNNINNISTFIKNNYKKLEMKLNYIDLLISLLEKVINQKNLARLLGNNVVNKKINYSESISINKNKMEYVDFSHDLFITSDDLTSSDDDKDELINSVNLVYSNTPFIAEYSN